ncbi:DUF6586 family protein [Marinobacter nauticus]|nr:DUF6586 family protein [Marinobacter nauticus]MBY5962280.1 hypothetical protein [Marinobacter nauticus]MBY6102458.1 hypothetical protein [Marinobacter nauticus]
MASQWHTLVSQKLFLAKTLLVRVEQDEAANAPEREAQLQGAIELLLRARGLLLVMIARCHQNKVDRPASIDELEALFPYAIAEGGMLKELAETPGSWWQQLNQLEAAAGEPPKTRKTVTEENIIAVSADQGPDRSVQALNKILAAMTVLTREIDEQHSEW